MSENSGVIAACETHTYSTSQQTGYMIMVPCDW